MELQVRRIYLGVDYTIGRLTLDGRRFCDTLEPPCRNYGPGLPGKKVPGHTAIPEGRYEVRITWSPRFRRLLPLLLGVYGFDGVRIHSGNTVRDTEGCLLVGLNTERGHVLQSRLTLRRLMEKLSAAADGKIYIEIA